MRRALLLVLLLLGVGGGVLTLGVRSRGETGETISRSFALSSDPEVAVLTVTSSGGLSGKQTRYVLYGDGRLVMERRGSPEVVYESSEAILSLPEARDLVGVAVDHGLLDISQQQLLAGVKEPSAITDAGSTTVEIQVASYNYNGVERGAVTNTLRLKEPWALRRWNPDNAVVAGMAELSVRLAGYRRRLASGGAR